MNAYIFDSVRTPRGKGKKDGSLHSVQAPHLAATVLKALKDRNPIGSDGPDDIIMGCVTQVWEQSGDIAKAAVMLAGFEDSVSGVTLNRFCGSGLEAVNQAAAQVISGQNDLLIAGGVESMSRVNMGTDGPFLLTDPQMIALYNIVPQGISADLIATKFGYTRERLDAFAVESHQKAARAWDEKRFERSIIPVKDINGQILLDKDETIRTDTSIEKMASLQPSFEMYGEMGGFDAVALQRYPEIEKLEYYHHPGNSSGIVDGAAAILIGNDNAIKKFGLKPRARIISWAVVGTEPTIMLTGPAPASLKALSKSELSVHDIHLFEVNEAFAVVPLLFMDELGVPAEKVNVNGGAIAMGHPLGATGAIILGTLLDELERINGRYGLATLCIGGGMGIATIIERIN